MFPSIVPSRALPLLAGALCCAGCRRDAAEPRLFELLSPAASGVTFVNQLPEDTTYNILNYLYYYNGGGVAAGDVDNDSLPDLFFTANSGPNRLYRNLGNYRFEDVTDRAGVGGPGGWSSGATMAVGFASGFRFVQALLAHHPLGFVERAAQVHGAVAGLEELGNGSQR